jgi:hypothetical protein
LLPETTFFLEKRRRLKRRKDILPGNISRQSGRRLDFEEIGESFAGLEEEKKQSEAIALVRVFLSMPFSKGISV